MNLNGRSAVVTGASSGIGEAVTRALVAEGMTVVAVARRAGRLDGLAGEHPAIRPHAADVTDGDAVARLAAWVEAEVGACHVLVNSAGARLGGRFDGPGDVEEVVAALDVNFLGTVRCMAAFAELLEASAPSRVVNIASVAGKLGIRAPGYAASKFATVGFSEAVAADWGSRGITVSQVNPGFVHTEGFPQDQFLDSRLTRRLVGTPEMVADAVVGVARSGARERTVPRWYRALITARHLAGPVFWAAAGRVRR